MAFRCDERHARKGAAEFAQDCVPECRHQDTATEVPGSDAPPAAGFNLSLGRGV
jgi:hypothetical protein